MRCCRGPAACFRAGRESPTVTDDEFPPSRKSRPKKPLSSPRAVRGSSASTSNPGTIRRLPLSTIRRASPTSLPVLLDLIRSAAGRSRPPGSRGLSRPGSERDDPVNLLHRGRAVQNLIDRALLQRSHSQVDRHPAEDVLGDLLEDQVAQLLAHHHDLEDARAAHVPGLEAGRAAQPAVELEVAMLVRVELQAEEHLLIGREGDPAIGADLADQALGDDRQQAAGELVAGDAEVVEVADRAGRVGAVERAEDEDAR